MAYLGERRLRHTRYTLTTLQHGLEAASALAGHSSSALDAGVDVITVQNLVGHADPGTTSRYDRRGERACRDGAALVHPPYVEPTE